MQVRERIAARGAVERLAIVIAQGVVNQYNGVFA